jgi:DNA helicase-2/ATP-dependent DNA helicase PcrA
MADEILKNLNPRQKQAVTIIEGPILILAGPGSGKTRVLTHRLAYLINSGISPAHILAVTFTNKAADEMRRRVVSLLADADKRRFSRPSSSAADSRRNSAPISVLPKAQNQRRSAILPFMGTFHSFGLRILRNEIDKLGYKKTFVIYDEDDQISLIKQIVQNLEINKDQFPAKKVSSTISALKSEYVDSITYEKTAQEYFEKTIGKIYSEYQKELKKKNALDFDDLIMLLVRIFEEFPEILKKYQEKFKYILVDEYQDTDPIQYRLIKLLSSRYKNLCVVGDDAQSIYSFRNADFRNILNFEKDYPQAKVITLDQNYRSTQNILDAASKVISKNVYQKPKNLWTENPAGPLISIVETFDEKSEAEFIVKKIKEFLKQGYKLNDFAVFYRTNAQSRAIEEALIRHHISYKLIGAIRFYQRKEIKDLVSYLKFILSDDPISLERIINVPPRGIGKITFEKIIKQGLEKAAKEKSEINEFYNLIKEAKKLTAKEPLSQVLKFILRQTKYKDFLKKTYGDNILQAGIPEDEVRWQNLEELINVSSDYDKIKPPQGLIEFLEKTSLLSDADEVNEQKEVVHLMTLHTAKGLEFPIIFIIGCEEGILPHSRSLINPLDIEEERRLFYVGITRSKIHLHLILSRLRTSWGMKEANPPSRFLTEIPEELIKFEEFSREDNEDIIDF